jgi:selenocysteine-specific elongation factor
LLDQREVGPGGTALGVLRCQEPVVAEYGQPFVLRQLSPATTVGGGQIISPALRTSDRFARCLAAAPGLASADASERLAAFIALRREATQGDCKSSMLGLNAERFSAAIDSLLQRKEIVATVGPQPIYVTSARFRLLKERLLTRCRQELERRKPASRVPASVVLARMKNQASEAVLEMLVKSMVAARELLQSGDRIGLPSGAELSLKQRQLLAKLLAEIAAAGRAPPTDKELGERHQLLPRDLAPLLQIGVDDGQLVRLSPQMVIDREAIDALRQSLAGYFQQHPTAKVGELREQWGITRKHAVPIFEFFDECRITLRQGDLRTAGPRLNAPIGETQA